MNYASSPFHRKFIAVIHEFSRWIYTAPVQWYPGFLRATVKIVTPFRYPADTRLVNGKRLSGNGHCSGPGTGIWVGIY